VTALTTTPSPRFGASVAALTQAGPTEGASNVTICTTNPRSSALIVTPALIDFAKNILALGKPDSARTALTDAHEPIETTSKRCHETKRSQSNKAPHGAD